MNDRDARPDGLVRQQAIRARCVHPSGAFVPFEPGDLEHSIPALFARQARAFRDRVAVKSTTQALTYGELDQASDHLAQAIVARRGAGAEPVALLFDRSAPLIVAILGVLKAGKAYMPLAPAFPESRLQQMLGDARPDLLVTDRAHLPKAERIARDRCEVLDRDGLSAGAPSVEPSPPISPDAPAALFYTSGSTGQPKGVVDTHRSLLHFVRTSTNQFHVCALDKVTFMASLGKDIFISLLNGACVYPIDVAQEGLASLGQWLIREEVTVLYSAASVLRSLTRAVTEDMLFPAVRLVVSIGEPLYRSDVDLFQRRFPPRCIFVNALGSTETSQFRHFFMDGDTRLTDGVAPAGYALTDHEVILLGEDGQPVGHDQPGKIAVRSRYLADGYWRKPDLTRAKFLPDPGGGPERIYLTGDLGLTLPDGLLLHLGREDAQVKIRGNRVELEEIEMALLGIDTVKEAVVVTRESSQENPRVVAYIVARGASPVSVSALRQALARTLPAHMIPSTFVRLDRVPRIGIGKVDRQALPAPSEGRPELDTPFAAPRTTVEKALARMWADALALPEVGLDDHFLEVGGHSLVALKIMARVVQAFGVKASIALLLEAGTIRAMARVIAEHGHRPPDDDAVERPPTAREPTDRRS